MACQTVKLSEAHRALGLASVRPGIGSGRHGAHTYCCHYKQAGFAAYCYLTSNAFYAIANLLAENGVTLNATILAIRDHDSNLNERRFTYVFMKNDADWFVMKTYLTLIDENMINDRFTKPVMYTL